ncbi:hypothetical protein CN378_22015 [Bacillus sp. AFS015802]|uniref:hypothetical protein n=1 Tax=Bacillus sp. AFS015802 TaxID=2033486 RepID=UPI000BF280E0|nr:hypothetical protein [Bacillus sp. AFS015802]PFA61863.1 hypothetical protein CN378_22015 [Bacillus sp. AFS015802]
MVGKYISWPNVVGALAVIAAFVLQVVWVPPYAATWDMVDFALGVLHFDMYQMQPHFPGYPYFILGGKALHLMIGDPVQALTLFNIITYASAVVPLFLLVKRMVVPSYAVVATALIYTSSFTVLMVNQPMSEGAAIGVMWWYIWSLVAAHERSHNGYLILPLFLFSLLLGIRLSYLVLGLGILLVLYRKWKDGVMKSMEIPLYLLVAILFQLLWISGISISEGGYGSFLRLALSFTNGHFQEWGGAIGAADLSLLDRVWRLIFLNTIWVGGAAESIFLLVLLIVCGFLLRRSPVGNHDMTRLILLLMGSYFLWALFAQNVMKPRHALPLIGMALFLIAGKLFSQRHSRAVSILLTAVLLLQFYHTSTLLYKHASDIPAVYQMADYLEGADRPLVVYTWEESRVLEYLDVPFAHKKVQTYEVFATDAGYYPDREIYVTDKVVQGFKDQGVQVDGFIQVEKQFHSSELIDPVYHDLTLYKWEKPRKEEDR